MPWDRTRYRDPAKEWPAVSYVDKVRLIQDFLLDEASVNRAMKTLQSRVVHITNPDRFRNYIEAKEISQGFNPEVVTINRNLTAAEFLTIVHAKKPMYDLGVPPRHGANTHRVQWQLIAIHEEETRTLTTGGITIADLYATFGSPKAFDRGGLLNLWNDVLDMGVNDGKGSGSSPEYLHGVLAKQEYPYLYSLSE